MESENIHMLEEEAGKLARSPTEAGVLDQQKEKGIPLLLPAR